WRGKRMAVRARVWAIFAVWVAMLGCGGAKQTLANGHRNPGGVIINATTFRYDRRRTGWNANETVLTPSNVASSQFGKLWESPEFDQVSGGGDVHPHMYASPLYVDSVLMTGGTYAGSVFSVVIAGVGNGYVYAVNAFDAGGVPAGTILWRKQL